MSEGRLFGINHHYKSMEIYQLRTFQAVARQGHLTQAAELLHLSQPAVTAQIKALEEELGITIASASVWKVTEHDYPHALVRLHWCKVREWTGQFEMREGQSMAWQTFPLTVEPVLPGAYPVLDWLEQEQVS